jgi:hypothetical protein
MPEGEIFFFQDNKKEKILSLLFFLSKATKFSTFC